MALAHPRRDSHSQVEKVIGFGGFPAGDDLFFDGNSVLRGCPDSRMVVSKKNACIDGHFCGSGRN